MVCGLQGDKFTSLVHGKRGLVMAYVPDLGVVRFERDGYRDCDVRAWSSVEYGEIQQPAPAATQVTPPAADKKPAPAKAKK